MQDQREEGVSEDKELLMSSYLKALYRLGWQRAILSEIQLSPSFPRGLTKYQWDRCLSHYWIEAVNFSESEDSLNSYASLIEYVSRKVKIEPDGVRNMFTTSARRVKVTRPELATLKYTVNNYQEATVGNCKIKVPSRFKENVTGSNYQLASLVVRYSLMGVNASMFWAIDPYIPLSFADGDEDGTLECFASPFNYTLKHFCSAFEEDTLLNYKDAECHGDFFTYINKLDIPFNLIVNPPFTDKIIDKTAEALSSYYERVDGKGNMIVALPNWTGNSGIDLLKAMKGAAHQELQSGEFTLYDSLRNKSFKPANMGLIFVVNIESNEVKSKAILDKIVTNSKIKADLITG